MVIKLQLEYEKKCNGIFNTGILQLNLNKAVNHILTNNPLCIADTQLEFGKI